jgi:hypothetical protein
VELERLYVTVLPDMSKFGSQLQAGVNKSSTVSRKAGQTSGSHFTKGFHVSVKGLIPTALILGAAREAGRAVSGFFAGAQREAEEANKSTAQTAAVIKSTGGVARVSAKGVNDLANAISRKTGIDDEQIAAGENMLLTFTQIRNRVGKNNDIFTQASRISVDLAKATGNDLVKSNVQLGKALNDPIRGITALSRVGVTFDDQQRKQITTMQKAGNVAGAQKIILAELRKEFGGSAEAQATLTDKMRVGWKNVQEVVGLGIQKSFRALSGTISAIGRIATGVFSNLDHSLGGSKGVFQSFADFLETHQASIIHGFIEGGKAALGLGEFILRAAALGLRGLSNMDKSISDLEIQFLDFVGNMIRGAAVGFSWIPGIGPKLAKASTDFDAFAGRATEAAKKQGKGAEAAANKLDQWADKAHAARDRMDQLGKTEVWRAKQRDAAATARIAISDIGRAGDATRLKLHS